MVLENGKHPAEVSPPPLYIDMIILTTYYTLHERNCDSDAIICYLSCT